ncbi:unnamed protein product [Echinostoma caproni]|uniref:NIF3-like protein 1 n=1 Tax=Echinostoma caproni TaxID=27848 RepID=A0A183AAR1_9TREM|nr:unnamed protein product [Echinostoma caproni]
MDLRRVVRLLNQYCSPHLADTWDNVGLLVQPYTPPTVSRALVTNDLTEPVLSEAEEMGANLIVSYHPPIFSPLKRITNSHWKERLVSACLEKGIAVYSPHTGLDAKVDRLHEGYGRIGCLKTPMSLAEVLQAYKSLFGLNHLILALGYGKRLDEPVSTIAVCAGSGSSILNGKTSAQIADVFVTGEMSHHDRLDAVSRGISVIIAGHSNTERGFLATRFVPEFQKVLDHETCTGDTDISSVIVSISQADNEPGVVF